MLDSTIALRIVGHAPLVVDKGIPDAARERIFELGTVVRPENLRCLGPKNSSSGVEHVDGVLALCRLARKGQGDVRGVVEEDGSGVDLLERDGNALANFAYGVAVDFLAAHHSAPLVGWRDAVAAHGSGFGELTDAAARPAPRV